MASQKILEIDLIAAQGLKTNLRRVRTYAVAWVHPTTKVKTRVDSLGGLNPTWNDKFLFRVSHDFVSGETSAVSFEIFTVGNIRDRLIGTVRLLLSTCLNKSITSSSTPAAFTAMLIRRPSGRFKGILNVAATVYDDDDSLILEKKVSAVSFRDLVEKKKRECLLSESKGRQQHYTCDLLNSGLLCGLMLQRRINPKLYKFEEIIDHVNNDNRNQVFSF